jgi:cob(I)alamin adenosyltransferase
LGFETQNHYNHRLKMKIYTKTGDKGSTALIGGKRVQKNHIRIEAYGTADELISYLAWLRDNDIKSSHKKMILDIQYDLMTISAILATDCDDCNIKLPEFTEENIVKLENEIDKLDSNLEPLKSFIIPGGDVAVSSCHVARTVCRRLERNVYTLNENHIVPEIVLKYLNRLSDYLFILSRAITADKKIKEIIWKPKLD